MPTTKLIRDNIPEIMAAKGQEIKYHEATPEEFWSKLKEKFLQEATIFVTVENKEEIGDLLEAIEAMCAYKGWTVEEIQTMREQKAKEKGRFEKRFILEG